MFVLIVVLTLKFLKLSMQLTKVFQGDGFDKFQCRQRPPAARRCMEMLQAKPTRLPETVGKFGLLQHSFEGC